MNIFFLKHLEVPIKLLTQNKITMFAFKPPPAIIGIFLLLCHSPALADKHH